MNNVSLYLKSHLFRSSSAAVELATKSPSEKNIRFAKKILCVKMADADRRLQLTPNCQGFYFEKSEKYRALSVTVNLLENKEENRSVTENDKNIQCLENADEDAPVRERNDLEINDNYGLRKPFRSDFCGLLLWQHDLSNKDLRNCSFTGANPALTMREISGQKKNIHDFSGSNLDGVDLSKVLLSNTSFIDASLKGTKLVIQTYHDHHFNFSGANLENAEINIALPGYWNSSSLDRLLNNTNNNDTLLNLLETIDDKYSNIKTKIMQNIVESLDNNNVDVRSVVFPRREMLSSIASKNYYKENKIISEFGRKLLEIEMIKANDRVTLNDLSHAVLNLFLENISQSDDEKKLRPSMIEKNGFFIQLMTLCNFNDDESIRNLSRNIYDTYLDMKEIRPFVEKDEFGNGANAVDWSDEDSLNYILVNKNKAMVIDYKNISKMLLPEKFDGDIKWGNFYYYDNGELQGISNINYEDIFANDFKIFNDNYKFDLKRASFDKLLSTLKLAEYEAQFKSVLSDVSAAHGHKLVGADNQIRLNEIFEETMIRPNDDAKETVLRDEHYEKILNVFNLEHADDHIKSQTLFSLAGIFSKYSSSLIFGTETESPQVLRNYAYALMSKANELDAAITGGNFGDWKDRLLGLNDAFTCTAVLSSIMMDHARTNFNGIISEIVPPAWR